MILVLPKVRFLKSRQKSSRVVVQDDGRTAFHFIIRRGFPRPGQFFDDSDRPPQQIFGFFKVKEHIYRQIHLKQDTDKGNIISDDPVTPIKNHEDCYDGHSEGVCCCFVGDGGQSEKRDKERSP